MRLRTKLFIGYAGFVLAIGVLGAWSARTLNQMSAVSGRIISENYDSVVAAQDMKESPERQDSAALFDLLGQHEERRRVLPLGAFLHVLGGDDRVVILRDDPAGHRAHLVERPRAPGAEHTDRQHESR